MPEIIRISSNPVRNKPREAVNQSRVNSSVARPAPGQRILNAEARFMTLKSDQQESATTPKKEFNLHDLSDTEFTQHLNEAYDREFARIEAESQERRAEPDREPVIPLPSLDAQIEEADAEIKKLIKAANFAAALIDKHPNSSLGFIMEEAAQAEINPCDAVKAALSLTRQY